MFSRGNFVATSTESTTPQLVFENLWGHNSVICGGEHMELCEAAGLFKKTKATKPLVV